MKENFQLEFEFNVSPSRVYLSWLESQKHQAMTGGAADIKNEVGYVFQSWDGYIHGTVLELEENQRIVLSWRTTEFDEQDEDSRLEIDLNDKQGACILKLNHTNIPKGQGESYKKGWLEHYFEPMEFFFDS